MLLAQLPDLAATDQLRPIRRIGIPRIDAVASELFNVRVTLAFAPSWDWREAFMDFENGVERSSSMVESPCLIGNALSVCGVREADVEFWFKLIDTKIAGANVQHAQRSTPTLAADVQKREAAGAERQRVAQIRADEIARHWEAPDA